jgi:serine/threonine-protein kinase
LTLALPLGTFAVTGLPSPLVTAMSALPDLIANRYVIVRELGRGGMALVYLARDLKHRRDVAIKVIRPELALPVGQDRFQREIGIAARLNHPNIVPLYDSGQAGGAFFFVMPYLDGLTLRERLRQAGPLPVPDAMAVLRDIARALAHAHDRGVVHRDVKPDNVMFSGDAAVVADFGIAKALDAAITGAGAMTITQAGAGIGTPAYMAPEQAVGDASIDHRADLYSLGCLAYEVFTGKPPFAGMHGPQLVAAHLTTEPEPVTSGRADVPPAAAAVIARCLQKDPARRPQSAREVLEQLDPSAGAPAAVPASRPLQVLRWVVPALAVGAIAAAAWIARLDPAGGAAQVTLAVLPFTSLGNDTTMSFVGQALTDEVAGALARVPGIQVKSRNGALIYRGQVGVDLAEAGERLKAAYLMTGVVRHQGGQWVLSADLARAEDATSLWGGSVSLSPDRTAGAAEALAQQLVEELRERFPGVIGSAPALAASQRTSSNEAYRLYLRGQERLARRGESVSESADLFRQAIRHDSLFAPAWSGLSMSLALFPFFEGVPSRDIEAELIRSAERALQLDPTQALPHVALGVAAWFDYRWDDAGREFRTAVDLDGRNVEALVQYARHLLFIGRTDEAMRQLQRARAEDPASALVLSWVAAGWFLQKELDSAMAESRRALDTDSSNYSTVFVSSLIRLATGRAAEARQLIDRAPRAYLVNEYVIARSGDPAEVRRRLAHLDGLSPQPWLSESRRALAWLGLGDTARALTALERASANREIWMLMVGERVPMFDPIRESPRYRELMRRIGLGQ